MNNDSSGLKIDAKYIKPIFKTLKYFGDCKNTVDVDHMWDATQMAQVIYDSSVLKLIDLKNAGIKFADGSRKIPKKMLNWFKASKNANKLYDENYLVCGINERQQIFFMYIYEYDTHFLFDVGY